MSQSWNSGYVADVAYVEGFLHPAVAGPHGAGLPERQRRGRSAGAGRRCVLSRTGLRRRHRRPADRRGEPGMAGHGHRLQPRPYRHRHGPRASGAPRQYPLRRSRHLAAGRQRPGRRHSGGGFRQPARHVVVGQQRRAGRHRPAAGRQDAPRRHGACELQFPAGLAGRNRHATTRLRGRPPVRQPQRPAGPGRACAGARDQGERRQISRRERLGQRPSRRHHRHVERVPVARIYERALGAGFPRRCRRGDGRGQAGLGGVRQPAGEFSRIESHAGAARR